MEQEKKSEINITNNFNAPIGQHIDHVDTINFRMDGEGNFHFEMVENANAIAGEESKPNKDEEMTFFIHPELEEDEGWRTHNEIKRLVARQGIQEICHYLSKLKDDKKVLLPQNAERAYNELVRLGMPNGEGYSLKTFTKYFKR